MTAMGKAMGAAAESAKSGAAKGVVDFREMKALLPKELPDGFKGQLKGEKTGAMGMSVAEAEGRYAPENGEGSITIKLTDMSGVAFGAMAGMAWAATEVDNETDSGYEKTTKINGYKALEKYDTKSKDGSIQIMVDNRFSIEVQGYGVKIEQIRAALKDVDLKKLAALKPVAPAAQ